MNKMMEYMALGKATVSFDLKEARYSAQDAALYARPNDDLHFAQCVCWLLDRPEQGRHMGEVGRQRASGSLAWEHSVPGLLRAYEQGLGLRAAGSSVAMPRP